MIARTTLSLVLLVSFAHALVHVYEQSLPSVEQRIAAEYFPDDAAAGKAFEPQRDVAVPPRLDEIGAGRRKRRAGLLFVAREHHRDVGVLQRPGRVHGAQRRHHHDVAALHVADAGPLGYTSIAAHGHAGLGRSERGNRRPPPLFLMQFASD